MGRGVLASELARSSSLWRFAGALLLPVVPAPDPKARATRWQAAGKLVRGAVKAAAFTLGVAALLRPAMDAVHQQHPLVQLLLAPALYYLFGEGAIACRQRATCVRASLGSRRAPWRVTACLALPCRPGPLA